MNDAFKKTTQFALAGAFVAALGMASAPAANAADDFEKCFGVAAKGQNDCASEGANSCAGTSTKDFDKQAWKLVKKGTCTATAVKLPDGAEQKGSLEAVKS